MSTAGVIGKGKRRRLSPSEKYEISVSVLTGQATQREAADRYGVDRSTVVTACRVARQGALDALTAAVPGRPGVSREQAALEDARASGATTSPTSPGPSGSPSRSWTWSPAAG